MIVKKTLELKNFQDFISISASIKQAEKDSKISVSHLKTVKSSNTKLDLDNLKRIVVSPIWSFYEPFLLNKSTFDKHFFVLMAQDNDISCIFTQFRVTYSSSVLSYFWSYPVDLEFFSVTFRSVIK